MIKMAIAFRGIFILSGFCWLQLPVAEENNTLAEAQSPGTFFPQSTLYPLYIVDPLRPTFSLQNMRVPQTDIIDTSERRYDMKIGGHLGIYRNQEEKTARGWQITVAGGFHGQFDPASSEDNVGWDGLLAISLEIRQSDKLAHRIGLNHVSSHVGDELIERTGIKRKNYTRQEIRYGLMWFMLPHWQSYFEAGKAYDLRNKLIQKTWRTELGFQYVNENYWKPAFGWYMGADISAYEENDWNINTTLQLGISSKVAGRNHRFGIEYYEGRSTLGEFFLNKERSIGFGFWIDI